MSDYTHSASARFLAGSFGLMLSAGASAALGGHAAIAASTILTFAGVVAGVCSIVLGINDFPVQALLSILILPCLALLYLVGMGALLPMFPAAGYALAVLGAGAFALALRPARGERVRHGHAVPAHAEGR